VSFGNLSTERCKAWAALGLAIKQKTQINLYALKEIIQVKGMNPEQTLAKNALSDGAITHKSSTDFENHQLQILSNKLKQIIWQEATI
jgi:hypothetical protein